MAIHRHLNKGVFEPEDVEGLVRAYDDALRALGLVDRRDPVCEIVAKKLLEIAQTGERNPQRLAALTVEHLGIPVTIPPDKA